MIQFILMLLGLAFPNNNTNTADDSHKAPSTLTTYSAIEQGIDEGGPVGGNTGQTPPTP